jgi:ABC-type dipeptide/oligopeptide/nickel transport system permease subunit
MNIRQINYPLYIGGALSLILLALAIFGPSLAPHDPMQVNGLMFIDGAAYAPPPLGRPLPPFISSDFALGLDVIGRDVLSRLLWAVRPTLVLCAAIVAVRVTLGVLLGVIAGWWGGRVGRLIDALIGISLSVPLLAFAVAALLAIQLERGLLAFVVALSITGWCDTAALVKSRTLAVRGAPYIESARAVGLRQGALLWRHVVPQLRPVLPVLIAFELSATLLLIAELGYLGYYIGGGFVYTYTVGNTDVQQLLVTGAPELGQMLSDFFGQLYVTPWVSICAGILVFIALIAFALLGEGLRRRLDVTRPRRLSWRAWRQRVKPEGLASGRTQRAPVGGEADAG